MALAANVGVALLSYRFSTGDANMRAPPIQGNVPHEISKTETTRV